MINVFIHHERYDVKGNLIESNIKSPEKKKHEEEPSIDSEDEEEETDYEKDEEEEEKTITNKFIVDFVAE